MLLLLLFKYSELFKFRNVEWAAWEAVGSPKLWSFKQMMEDLAVLCRRFKN